MLAQSISRAGLLGAAFVALATPAVAASLDVVFPDLKRRDGAVTIFLFDGEDGWRGKVRAVRKFSVPATAGQLRVDGLAPGVYGFKAFQDLDGDGRLKTGALGLPAEPYGFSNGAGARGGPPPWSAARFTLPADGARQTLVLR